MYSTKQVLTEEILVNVSPSETRVAFLENGLVQELYIERNKGRGLVGNIYKGKVLRILPGMQAAFVDIGLAKAGFMHADDINVFDKEGLELRSSKTEDIRSLLHDGQELYVQVVKDPLGTKGARLTTHLSVSARYLVYMPNTDHVGISNTIENADEKDRLYELVSGLRDEYKDQYKGGFIVRTVAEGKSEDELRADIPFVYKLWHELVKPARKVKAPSLIYEDMPLHMRTVRDLIRSNIERVKVDAESSFQEMQKFAKHYVPEVGKRIELYQGERPLFEIYGVEEEIQRALSREVPLKSGGYLVVDQTEAMTTVDVNTGAFVGKRNLEETIFKTNMEAAAAIARQLRFRNIGGIIIIDFIDMEDAEHKRQVHRTLEKLLEKDRARTSITGVSELGLVEMTRKRTRESLGRTLCEPCPVCNGRGVQKSAQTVCFEIFRDILREAKTYDSGSLRVLASQKIIDYLLDEESDSVADLEHFISKTIEFSVETLYTQEQYDIVLT